MRTDFAADDPDLNVYKLLTAVVVPRPIAWVSTLSGTGVVNLAPHSFYTVACARPPIVQFTSVGRKDTLRNVLATGEFVVNLATAPLLDQVNNSSARFAPDQSEVDALGIAMEPSVRVRPPRVVGSPASIECTLHSTNELGDSTVVLGDVRMISVAQEALVDGHPEFTRLDPLSRLGRDEWGLHAEVVSVRRPARPEDVR
ncbi:flavin reductase family protein [Nocardioides sp. WL0053]|jgi:flavin reductase (DIM6/NTAB) family NADH-FMN oxidoreductase RutF|uniref:Flavin reductase family protein n=1 Tax=Nocardioides jiangsuensis TaxID=2866161 RepID=A0ABS7RE52_9ACTN|nr:flavin reductase family protein [Nocardioides jiangsuensis]MBY9073292.1 flavin reductase family protein [Nocardioides jiangsuensis]